MKLPKTNNKDHDPTQNKCQNQNRTSVQYQKLDQGQDQGQEKDLIQHCDYKKNTKKQAHYCVWKISHFLLWVTHKTATIKIIIAVSVEWQWICLVDNVDPELRALFAFQKVAEKVKEVPQLMRSISAIENDWGGSAS